MLGDLIKPILKERGITQTALATALGLVPSTITKIFNGDRLIKAHEITEMARFLEISPEDILESTSKSGLSLGTTLVIPVGGIIVKGGNLMETDSLKHLLLHSPRDIPETCKIAMIETKYLFPTYSKGDLVVYGHSIPLSAAKIFHEYIFVSDEHGDMTHVKGHDFMFIGRANGEPKQDGTINVLLYNNTPLYNTKVKSIKRVYWVRKGGPDYMIDASGHFPERKNLEDERKVIEEIKRRPK